MEQILINRLLLVGDHYFLPRFGIVTAEKILMEHSLKCLGSIFVAVHNFLVMILKFGDFYGNKEQIRILEAGICCYKILGLKVGLVFVTNLFWQLLYFGHYLFGMQLNIKKPTVSQSPKLNYCLILKVKH